MIYGHLSDLDSYRFLLAKPAWKTVFDWLQTVTARTPRGIQKLQGDQIYVNVHGYDTQPLEQCRYEAHRRYIDLQFCIEGGEFIECERTSLLTASAPYNPEKDIEFFPRQGAATMLKMTPGTFALLYPSDAHAPKISNGKDKSTFKLVVKIDAALV